MMNRRAAEVPQYKVAATAARAFTALLTEILEPLDRSTSGDEGSVQADRQYTALRQVALVRRGRRLATHLLAWAGGQQLKPVRLEPMPFLANLRYTLRGVVDSGIDVTVEVGRDCPACEADADALEVALMHLTRYALDTVPRAGHFCFSAQADVMSGRPVGNPTVAMSVFAAEPSRSLHCGHRANPLVSPAAAQDPSAEMPLAAADGFARQSGGCVTVESIPGGTRATVHLPTACSLGPAREGESALSSNEWPTDESHLRRTLDPANDAIVTVDSAHIVVMANQAAAQMFRCPFQELIGAPLERFFARGIRDDHERLMRAFGGEGDAVGGRGWRAFVTCVRSDGDEFPADALILHASADGRQRYTVILGDTTDGLQVDSAARRKSEALLRRLLALLPEAIVVSSSDRISFVNAAAQCLLGADASALLGRPFLEIIHPDSMEKARLRLLSLHDGIATVPLVEVGILRSDGTTRIVQTIATAFDDRGETSILSAMRDVTDLRQARADLVTARETEEQLQRLARVDALTATGNRRSFEEQIDKALARCRRTGQPGALLLLDLDGFKAVNDTHGHGIGDQVLKEFAARLKACARATDTVARLGGDEFAFLVEGLRSGDDAQAVVRKLRTALEPAFVFVGLAPLCVTASIGLAVFSEVDPDAAAWVARADQALYQAKHAGRNTFAVSGWHCDGVAGVAI